MQKLRASWLRAWQGLGAAGDGEALMTALLARYAEPQRHYHTQQHLAEVLRQFSVVQSLAGQPAEVEMALWFHDAVYDVHGHDNEFQSAQWAQAALLQAGVAEDAAARVHALVMATRHTAQPQGSDAQLLVDLDLSILGADAQRFAEYEHQIRGEYSFVPQALFNEKRRAILLSFLDRARIYSTAYFHDLLEARARDNLRLACGL